MANIQPILDHIVLLVPHETLLHLPPWLSQAFTILDGGRHADGVTENKLVLFQDGVYLELIAFRPGHEQQRHAHRWGHRREGHIVDWANTLRRPDDLAVIRARVAAATSGAITYSDPVAGGRVRPDGTELQWTVSAPLIAGDGEGDGGSGFAAVGGEAPFWCLDRTPRELRVPHRVAGNVGHPSGALGVAGVTVSVRSARVFEVLKKTYDALQGQAGKRREAAAKDEDGDENAAAVAAAYEWSLVVPETARGDSIHRTLVLAHDPEAPPHNKEGVVTPDVYVGIDLVGSGAGAVSGRLGDENWVIEFKLRA